MNRFLPHFLLYTSFLKNFIYLFIFGCVGSSLLRVGLLQLWQAGATSRCGARASHCGGLSLLQSTGSRHLGLSSCDTRAQQLRPTDSRAQAQQLQLPGPVALRHVGSSRTSNRTHVPCIGRWILNHCTTREALPPFESENLASTDLLKVLHVPLFHILNIFFLRGSPFLSSSMGEILLLFLIQINNSLIYSVYTLLPPNLRHN